MKKTTAKKTSTSQMIKLGKLYVCLEAHLPLFETKKDIINARNGERAPFNMALTKAQVKWFETARGMFDNKVHRTLIAGDIFMVVERAGKYKQYLKVICGDQVGWVLYNVCMKSIIKV